MLHFLFMLVPTAFAQDPCVGVPGGCSAGTNVLANFVPALGQLFVGFAGGAAVLFTVIGGVLIMFSFGDESRVSKGKNSIIFALVGFGIVLVSQTAVAFVQRYAFGVNLEDPFTSAMGQVVQAILDAFNVIFVILVIVAGFRMVIGRGQTDKFNAAKMSLFWIGAGAIAVNLAAALVRAVMSIGL